MKTFNQSVSTIAISMLDSQPLYPNSPGQISTACGEVSLCLGAIIASAATQVTFGRKANEEFVGRLFEGNGKNVIRHQFKKLGWTREEADTRIAINDATALVTRHEVLKREIVRFFACRDLCSTNR